MVYSESQPRLWRLAKGLWACLILIFLGCSTPYQRDGLTGGYTNERVSDTSYRIRFKANNYTSKAKVERSLLYRCAELTNQLGYKHFIVVSQDTIDISDPIAKVAFQRNYHATALIRVLNSPDNPIASNAKEIMAQLQDAVPRRVQAVILMNEKESGLTAYSPPIYHVGHHHGPFSTEDSADVSGKSAPQSVRSCISC